MKAASVVIAMLLVFGLTMTSGAAGAEESNPFPATQTDAPATPQELRARKTMELEAWLRRLVGSFKQYSGVSSTGVLKDRFNYGKTPDGSELTGLVDCVAIGSGPGVHCMYGSVVQPRDQPVGAGQQDFYRVGMLIQFGINPNSSEIQILVAWKSGLVSEGSAQLRGDTVEWTWPCEDAPARSNCRTTLRMSAPSDGEYVKMTLALQVGSANFKNSQSYLVPLPRQGGSAAEGPARISRQHSDYLDMSKRMRRPR